MGIAKGAGRRQRLAIGVILGLLVGMLPLFTIPASANHPNESCLDIYDSEGDPETDTNPTGATHTLTATLRGFTTAPAPSPENPFPGRSCDETTPKQATSPTVINFEISGNNDPNNDGEASPPDRTCTIPTGGSSCDMAGYTGYSTGTDTIRGWIDGHTPDANEPVDERSEEGTNPSSPGDEPDSTDVVSKTWSQGVPGAERPTLDCEPETSLRASGEAEPITCTARLASGQPAPNMNIDFEQFSGPNDPVDSNISPANVAGDSPRQPDYTCTTDASGTCSITPNTTTAGTQLIRAWIDNDKDNATATEADSAADPDTNPDPEADSSEGRDEVTQPGLRPEPDDTDVVERTAGASRVDCSPETDRNPTGTAHTLSCRASDEGNGNVGSTEIDVEATGANDPDNSDSIGTPDFTCVTNAQGQCSVVHGPGGSGTTNQSGLTTYRAWIDLDRNNVTQTGSDTVDTDETRAEGTDTSEPDNTDVVEKTWFASLIDCTPETDTNPAETAHTVTCTTRDQTNAVTAGTNIDIEATGINDPDNSNSLTTPDFSCTTNTSGQCSFTHGPGGRGTTNNFGKTTYRAWIDEDNNDATPEADPTEERNETGSAEPSPTTSPSPTSSPSPSGSPSPSASPTPAPTSTPAGTRAEPDSTDVVEKNWSAVPDRLSITPETDTAAVGSCNAFTITAIDAAGKPVPGVVVDVEQRHDRSDNTTANDEPTVSFCRPAEDSGANPSDVDPTRGDLGSGDDGTLGGEAENVTNADGKVTIGISVAPRSGSNGTGNVLVTAFYESEDNDDPDPADPQDAATKTWITSQARSIDCSPETARNRVGTQHMVTCTVLTASGQPAGGEGVRFTEEGPGAFTTSSQVSTNSQGQASVTTTSSEPGTQLITGTLVSSTQNEPDVDDCERAAGDPSGAAAGSCSDTVEKVWRQAATVQSGPCRNFLKGSESDRRGGGKVIVGTEGADVLVGTRGDDLICGLGGNDIVRGRGGDDRIYGAGGRDRLEGAAGADLIRGGGKSDVLLGQDGADDLGGGRGDDSLKGGSGSDRLDGGPGRDRCAGGAGRDTLRRCE